MNGESEAIGSGIRDLESKIVGEGLDVHKSVEPSTRGFVLSAIGELQPAIGETRRSIKGHDARCRAETVHKIRACAALIGCECISCRGNIAVGHARSGSNGFDGGCRTDGDR